MYGIRKPFDLFCYLFAVCFSVVDDGILAALCFCSYQWWCLDKIKRLQRTVDVTRTRREEAWKRPLASDVAAAVDASPFP